MVRDRGTSSRRSAEGNDAGDSSCQTTVPSRCVRSLPKSMRRYLRCGGDAAPVGRTGQPPRAARHRRWRCSPRQPADGPGPCTCEPSSEPLRITPRRRSRSSRATTESPYLGLTGMRFSAPSLKLELRESNPFNHKHTFCVMGLSGGVWFKVPVTHTFSPSSAGTWPSRSSIALRTLVSSGGSEHGWFR